MAAKVTLGKRPPTFTRAITAPMPEGGDGTVTVQFRYRTRAEFGEFVDTHFAAMRAAPTTDDPAADASAAIVARALAAGTAANVSFILGAVAGWDLDVPFGRDAVQQLCEELPGHAIRMVDDYRAACTEGRLGN